MHMTNDIGLTTVKRETSLLQSVEWRNSAHDIKNILASLSLIAEELADSDARRPQLLGTRLERGCARILEICAAQPATKGEEDEDLPQTVADVVGDVEQLANSLACENVHVSADACSLELDDTQAAALFRVIANLVTNAVVAMEGIGGEVLIRARSLKEALVVDVIDTGPGLFAEPCETAAPSRNKLPKRSGSGMTIAEVMARRINADLSVQSTGPAGTTFRLSMPLAGRPN